MRETSFFHMKATPRRLRAAWVGALTCMIALFGGCTDESPNLSTRARSDAPVLVPIDSVTLVENDRSYVAEPGDMAIAPDGTFLIADRFVKQVHAFDREGGFVGKIGQRGEGPGEFMNPGFLALDGDSLLYAVDTSEIEVFDLRTFSPVRSYRVPRTPGIIAVSAGRLFAGYADPEQLGSIARISGDSAQFRVTGPFPELLRNEALFPMFNPVALALKGDTAATAYVVTDHVYLSDVGGRVLDSIQVPAMRRHGVDPAVLRRFAKNVTDQKLGEAAVYGTSLPTDLHWLPENRIALVSTDWKVVDSRFVESSYLSVIDPKARRSCVDAVIPGPTDPPVRVAMRGDTLFVLSQEVYEDTRLSTRILSYRVNADACQWVSR